jgi:hypothetical protein
MIESDFKASALNLEGLKGGNGDRSGQNLIKNGHLSLLRGVNLVYIGYPDK